VIGRREKVRFKTYGARANNLTLNIAKSQEILFSDKKRKERFSAPAEIAELNSSGCKVKCEFSKNH